MTYAAAIHHCRTRRERLRAFEVDSALSYLQVANEETFQRMLGEKLRELLPGAELQPIPGTKRVDVLVDGRTVMSWTPTLN